MYGIFTYTWLLLVVNIGKYMPVLWNPVGKPYRCGLLIVSLWRVSFPCRLGGGGRDLLAIAPEEHHWSSTRGMERCGGSRQHRFFCASERWTKPWCYLCSISIYFCIWGVVLCCASQWHNIGATFSHYKDPCFRTRPVYWNVYNQCF